MIFHQMLEKDKPMWPERFAPEYIERLMASYQELGRLDKFYQEYMNIPFNPDDTDFSSKQITHYNGELKYNDESGTYLEIRDREIPVDVVMGLDPSTGLSNDYTGIVIMAIDTENKRYLIVAERRMLKPDEMIDLIFKYHSRYHPRKIVIEEVAMQVLIQYWLRAEMKRRGTFLPLRGEKVPTRVSKEDKIRNALQPIYASGVMHHLPSMLDLETELFTFPKAKHDDILDALFLASRYARRAGSKRVVRKLGSVTKKIKRYDWMTQSLMEE